MFYHVSGNDEEVKVTLKDTFSRWKEIQNERRQRIKKACQKYTSLNMTDTFFSRVLVDDVHRVIYTPIPEAGSSSWKWLLLALLTISVILGFWAHQFTRLKFKRNTVYDIWPNTTQMKEGSAFRITLKYWLSAIHWHEFCQLIMIN